MPASQRSYANHRKEAGLPGGTLRAVQQAIKTGRLYASVVIIAGVPKLRDFDHADREWLASTDPGRYPPATLRARATTLASAAPADRRERALLCGFAEVEADLVEVRDRILAAELGFDESTRATVVEVFETARAAFEFEFGGFGQ
jgi:hypothetical protein